MIVSTIVIESLIWRGVASLRRESRVQLDNMIFQAGILSPLMYDYINVLQEIRAKGEQGASGVSEDQDRLLAIRRRIEPHLTVLRQTTDLLSNVSDIGDVKHGIAETIAHTRATLERAQAETAAPITATRLDGLVASLEDDLGFFAGSVVHTIEEDLNVQQQRSNLFATLIGTLFSVLLAAGLSLLWLVAILRRKTRALNRLATTDPLTGLINRGECMRQAARIGLLAQRKNVSVAVAVIDLDHFKAVNDTHGHPAGDAVLQSVARTLGASRRESDVVARLGGEEFAIVMYDTNAPAGAALAERVRQDLESSVISFNDTVIPMTASIGVATGSGQDASFERLYAVADKALYRAKAMGRNRTIVVDSQDTRDTPFSTTTNGALGIISSAVT